MLSGGCRKNRDLLEKLSWWGFITGVLKKYAEIELYDLKKAPLERTNLAAKRPDVARRLKISLLEWDSSVDKKMMEYSPASRNMIIPYP